MLFTVSTVKDTLPHVQRFVAGNLVGGIDHLVVLLDAPDDPDQAEVRGWLEAHPHVTCLPTDEVWWAGDRPERLNVRQRTSANLVKSVLADVPEARWLFHVDADEIVRLDPEALAAVPDDLQVVQLATWETLSRTRWDVEPHLFKTPLDEDDLILLHTLGVVDRPINGAYFHGHVEGKSGVRPTAEAWLTLHKAVDADRTPLPAYTDDRLVVLHYESYSGEEFVRKWLAMIGSGPRASFRPARGDTASALRTLVAKGLPPERLEPYLLRVFEQTTQDDERTLTDLGMLTDLHVLPAASHVPAPLPAAVSAVLDARFDELRAEPKRRFHPARAAQEAEPAREGRTSRRRD